MVSPQMAFGSIASLQPTPAARPARTQVANIRRNITKIPRRTFKWCHLTDRASGAATRPFGHYPALLTSAGSCMRLLGSPADSRGLSWKKPFSPQVTTGRRSPPLSADLGVVGRIRPVHLGRVGEGSRTGIPPLTFYRCSGRLTITSADPPGDPSKEGCPKDCDYEQGAPRCPLDMHRFGHGSPNEVGLPNGPRISCGDSSACTLSCVPLK
jgi:hypothetical protein